MTNKKFAKVYNVLNAINTHFAEASAAGVQGILYSAAQITDGEKSIQVEVAEALQAMEQPNTDEQPKKRRR